jgi:hypothetical protein
VFDVLIKLKNPAFLIEELQEEIPDNFPSEEKFCIDTQSGTLLCTNRR